MTVLVKKQKSIISGDGVFLLENVMFRSGETSRGR